MQKHVLDRPKQAYKPGLDRVVEHAVKAGPHKATLSLQKRPRHENATQRARHFMRIEKDGEA